jgi:phytoene dehydrogenase-like protein
MGSRQVVVVGAGCAGLMAAHVLKKNGVDVVALESAAAAGGRCRNIVRKGYNISLGAGMTEPQWLTTYNLCRELGIADEMVPVTRARMGFCRNGKVHYMLAKGSPLDHIRNIPETLRFRGMPLKAISHILKLGAAMKKRLRDCDIENRNFDALLDLGRVSSYDYAMEHAGPEAVHSLADPFMNSMVLTRPERVCIAHLMALMSLTQGMNGMLRGMGSITEGLYQKIRDSVRLSTPVKEIVIKDRKVRGVETRDGFIEAEHVICATDAVVARKIMPDLPASMREPLETCNYSSTYLYAFGCRRKLTPDKTLSITFRREDDPKLAVIFETAGHVEGTQPDGSSVIQAYTAGWHDVYWSKFTPEERLRAVIREVRRYLPDFPDQPDVVETVRWDRAVNEEGPGQFNAIHDLLKNHMNDVRGLHLAGEYLFLIACTEGAFATGEAAARAVLSELNSSAGRR